MIDHATDAPAIAIVRSSRGWARTLHRYVVDYGGAVVKARPLEERQAIEEEYDILIVGDISSFLNNHIVEELHRRGRRVLGVYDPTEMSLSDDNPGKQRLLKLGADGVIESEATPEEFVRALSDLAPPRHERVIDTSMLDEEMNAMIAATTSTGRPSFENPNLPRSAGASSRRRGHITAVLGASGGSGATEISVELARALSQRGERAVLVDGDDIAPSIAQRLNLSLHPNIRTAVDVVMHGAGRLSECLTVIANGLEVLVGLPHPKDWVEVRPTEITAVLDELSRGRPQIVVNASPMIEDLGSFGMSDRFGMSRAAVARADTIVITCSPTPMGVARLIDHIADLSELSQGKAIYIVVNKSQKSSFKRNEIANEIKRSFNPGGICFVPMDQKVDRAAWEGTLVANSDFTKTIASELVPVIPRAIPVKSKTKKVKAQKAS